MAPTEIESRVLVTRRMMGLLAMQVCCVEDATDKQILDVCNQDNPCGTSNGWCNVINSKKDALKLFSDAKAAPVKCDDTPGRLHKVVLC